MDSMSIEELMLRFAVPPDDDSCFSETDKAVLARLYRHQFSYRARIERSAPGSVERESIIGQMYAEAWAITAESDFYGEYAGNAAELTNRTKHALALLRLSRARRVLEVGVGQGALAEALGSQGCWVDGIDVAPGLQWNAIQARLPERVRLWTGSVRTAPESTYDLCVADNVLEHIPSGDYEMFLDSCYRALRPGGWLAVCVPSPLTGPHDSSRWFTPPGEPATADHFNERTMTQLKADFQRVGLGNLRTTIIHDLSSGRVPLGWARIWLWRAQMLEHLCSHMAPSRRTHPIFRYTIPRTLAGQKPH